MDIRTIIGRKRDGVELTAEEISSLVFGYTRGEVAEAQMAALLMAVVVRGMTGRETADLTLAMLATGDRLDLSSVPGVKVDKHSTGGVGDKTTLVVAPLVAALGVAVPKMSGRALGHTGGTIDKLECVPGLTTELSPERFIAQLADIGVAIAAQSARMAPADKRMYALRDLTGTVESIPLIASSVMSKKLAIGADAILLDVKVGRGAFMPDVAAARGLANAMVEVGGRAGKRVVALVTRMDQPLGRAVGDAAELAEAIETLGGRGPRDFTALCELVAGHMLVLGGAAPDPRQGRAMAAQALCNGTGLAKLRQLVLAQGGDPGVLDQPQALMEGSRTVPVLAAAAGYITAIDAKLVGEVVRELKSNTGAGKERCGLLLKRKVGEPVSAGDLLAVLTAPSEFECARLEMAAQQVAGAFQLGAAPRRRRPLLVATVMG